MLYEDAMDMFMLYSISPELTCSCDEFHVCQQCMEDEKTTEDRSYNTRTKAYSMGYQVIDVSLD